MQKDIASAGVELAEARTQIDKVRKSLGTGTGVLEERASELQAVQRLINDETKKLKGFTDELDSLKEEINGRKSAIVEVDLEVGKMEKEVEKAKKDEKDAKEKVAKREKEFDWIADECQCAHPSLFPLPFLLSLTLLLLNPQDLRQGELAVQLRRPRHARCEGEVPTTRGEPPQDEAQSQPESPLDD